MEHGDVPKDGTKDSLASPSGSSGSELPFVSVVMPVRNESHYIERTLSAVLAQDYPPDRLEVIVADGMSTDGTRELLMELARLHPQLKIIDNPGRIVSTGLNAAIKRARGEIIIRVDGHAEIAADFVRQDVVLLDGHPEAWVVGGPIVHAGRKTFGKAAAIAMSHPLGVGMARHRFPDYEGYAEGAAFPALRRWVFSRVGEFDERLVRNQDDEWNYRIAQAGGKIFVSPRVRYVYFVRESPRKLFRQYMQYSFWRIPVIRKHKRPTTRRQMVPALFFLTMLALLVVGLGLTNPWVALALPVVYVATLLVLGLSVVPQAGFRVGLLVPLAIATIHVAYAVGIAYGLFSVVFRPKIWDHSGGMSTLSR
jgi:glycosyltransferase involved in cell wall biosynthesis